MSRASVKSKFSSVLFLRSELGSRSVAVSVDGDRLVAEDGVFYLIADAVVLAPDVFLISAEIEALREWSSFSRSVRSVVLSSLFDDAGDLSATVKNSIQGGLLVLLVMVLLGVNGLRGEVGDISAQLTQVQGQVSQPVQLELRGGQ